jgi:3-oxoacyl-[acyl-carrier protein] reductase
VVNGGAGGIGRAVVLRLAQANFFPVILDKADTARQGILDALTSIGRDGDFICLELTKREEVQSAFSKVVQTYGCIDLLVNLAGGTIYAKRIEDLSLSEWREVIDVNLKATFLCCQAVIAVMKNQKRGVIINTSSNIGVTGDQTRTAYAASKAAVIAFTKSLALELASYGIRVNNIAPGLTATARVRQYFSTEQWSEAGRNIPMGRVGLPEDIAEGVAFLASEESRYMSGQTLHVNGGLVMP